MGVLESVVSIPVSQRLLKAELIHTTDETVKINIHSLHTTTKFLIYKYLLSISFGNFR